MEFEQLAISMPVLAIQVTVRREAPKGWVVDARLLREQQGWQMAGRYTFATLDEAELHASDLLDELWRRPPLD